MKDLADSRAEGSIYVLAVAASLEWSGGEEMSMSNDRARLGTGYHGRWWAKILPQTFTGDHQNDSKEWLAGTIGQGTC